MDGFYFCWPRLMDRRTLARYLDNSEKAVEELLREGLKPTFTGARRERFDRHAVDAILDRLTAAAGNYVIPGHSDY